MGEFAQQLDEVASIFARAAAEQGGVLSGDNPTHYNEQNPIRLWVIQVVIIIVFSQVLALALGKIRQPRVIAEVIGGILLGPTVMGRIPHFKETIFPDKSMPLLALTANIGLILFLFLVGLEIDTRLLKRNAKASLTVSVVGLVIPLGLGAALGVGVYRQFIKETVNFGYFLLFIAVAIGITAFPVLCRILTELKLLDTQVGVVVLSAGIGNDVVGWILLALTVALVNASQGLTALYVLLVSVGYTLFLLYPVRWGFVWLARRTGSLEQGTPTPFMMTVTVLVVFVSAFFTDIIGVHAIFGGFLAGLIIPHDNGFAIALVEKIEDLITILLIPIYFTLSGLRTNLGLLDDGVTWGYVILICLVAFASKFIPCAGAALAFGFNWREAGAIGSLMSCKGLVELIVLNIGLQANILEPRTFSMFVVHALILTFMTTPLTLLFYPPRYRNASPATSGRRPSSDPEKINDGSHFRDSEMKTKFALVLEKVEQLAPAMTLTQLLQPHESTATLSTSSTAALKAAEAYGSDSTQDIPSVEIDTLRLLELGNRTSDVIRSQEAEALIYNDPVVSAFRTFGTLNRIMVSASVSVVNFDQFSSAISQHATSSDAEMVIIPWARGTTLLLDTEGSSEVTSRNPFDGAFHRTTTQDQTTSVVYSEFIRSVFLQSPTDVALFVDRGVPSASISSDQHLFLPFFGGPDDRLALSFLVQLCVKTGTQGTVVRIYRSESAAGETLASPTLSSPNALTVAAADTVYGALTTQARLASDTEDNLIWERYTGTSSTHSRPIASALAKISFSTESSAKPLHKVVELVKAASERVRTSNTDGKTLIVLAGRSRRMAAELLGPELREVISETNSPVGSSAPKTLGDVGAALVATGAHASLLILQASVGSAGAA